MAKYRFDGINEKTYELLTKSESNATIDMQLSRGLFEIDWYSHYKHNLFTDFSTFLWRWYFFPNLHRKNFKVYNYKSKEENFDFVFLHKYFKYIFGKNSEIYNILMYNYKNGLRASTCRYSIIIACYIENSIFVMGNMPVNNGESVLHRFVEVEHNGELYVIDVVKNIIMRKDDYYKVSQFQELTRIESKDLRVIYNFIMENGICDHTRIFSMFGNELLKELEEKKLLRTRNEQIPDFKGII